MADAVAGAIAGRPPPGGRGGHRRRQELRLPGAGHPGRPRPAPAPRTREGPEGGPPAAHRRLHPHDQPPGAVDRQGHPVPRQRDPAGVHGGAGQGPGQLPQPAAAGQGRRAGRQPLRDRRGARPTPPHPPVVAQDGRRLAGRPGLPPAAGQVWDEVASDTATAWAGSARTYADCFYYRARRRVHNAQILVVNHALFFSDLALRMQGASILPDYDVVIFDEAHNIEAVAGDHLGLSVTSGQVDYVLQQALQRPHQPRAAGPHRLRRGPAAGAGVPAPGRRLLRRRRRLARPAAQGQRPRPRAGDRAQPAQPRASRSWPAWSVAGASRSRRPTSARTSRGGRPARRAGRRRRALARGSSWPTRSTGSRPSCAAASAADRAGAAPIDVGPVLREHLFNRCPPW